MSTMGTLSGTDIECTSGLENQLSLAVGSPASSSQSEKRNDYISWDEYFMASAFLAAKRSKDPSSQVGACIVDKESRIIGTGYNGFPRGCSDDDFPWSKTSTNCLENKYMYVVHAEANAILNKNAADIRGSRLYVALFPCNECAKLIIQSGISEVIYMSDKHATKEHTIASKELLTKCGVQFRKYETKQKCIVIDFSEIDWDNQNQLPPTPCK